MPKTWVFSLSFEFFPWVLRVFSWVLSFSLSLGFCFIVFVSTVAKLACYIDKLSTQRYVTDIDTKPQHNIHLRWIKTCFQRKYNFFKKCRKFKFGAWVLVFSLSFKFFLPWVFSNGQKQPASSNSMLYNLQGSLIEGMFSLIWVFENNQ